MTKRFLLSPHSIAAIAFVIGSLLRPDNSLAYSLINLNTLVDYDTNAINIDTAVDVDGSLLDTETRLNATSSLENGINLEEAGNGTGLTGSATGTVSSDSVMMQAEELTEGAALNISRIQAEAANSGSVVVVSPKAVTSNADLQAYALGALRSDSLAQEFNFTSESVRVEYKEEGRFLALIPITFTVTATAYANGTVEVEYPWYSVMTVDKKGEMEAQVKVAVDNALRARMVGSVRAEGEGEQKFTAAESADVAAQIHSALKAGIGVDNTVE